MANAEKVYWNELNKIYGLNIEEFEELKLDMSAAQYDMAMGSSFDDAMQRNLKAK